MQRVIVSVINDLSTDQRVHKTCHSLHKNGFEVLLIGRKQKKSLPLSKRVYKTQRMQLIFEKGPLFYMEYQMRLLLLLLFTKSPILYANDLDTLLPNFIASKIKKSKLIYDTHELFCEVPELKHTPIKRFIWKKTEAFIFPKLQCVFSVNDSIANIYSKEYNVPVHVIKNAPLMNSLSSFSVSKNDLKIAEDSMIILLQGAGINTNRGAEEAVMAMQHVNKAVLLIVGDGDVLTKLKAMVQHLKLDNKVLFIGKVPFEKLSAYTQLANIGLSLDKNTNMNYCYSLPNKVFDYIHAGVPILASDITEVKKIISFYNIGTFIENHSPQHIAQILNKLLANKTQLLQWKQNTLKAKACLNWEIEEQKLIQHLNSFLF
jgi:glycosyltransferase involved in cell wall biosynthesis